VKAEDYKEIAIENKKLKSDLAFERTMLDNVRAEYKSLQDIIKKLKDRIDVLYEFIERNDKLVDEVIDEEDLDKLNRYIYIDDDLVDRTLESED
jgi:cell division septum initiation protein DivIVA